MENNGQIDLLALIKKLWIRKSFIFRTTIIFLLLGLFIALLTPKTYTAGSTFIPMMSSDQKANGLSGLASLAGINLDGSMGGSDISPTLYPEILASVPFKAELAEVMIPYESKQYTFKNYALNKQNGILQTLKKYTVGLPGLFMSLFNSKDSLGNNTVSTYKLVYVKNEDYDFYKNFENYISINVDLKEGFIELNVTYDDPVRAAILAQKAQEILQKRVIEYKIKQAKEVLSYTQEQYNLKKSLLYSAQANLAGFKDRNIFISTSSFQTQLLRLESDYNNANIVYQELAKQVEQAKLQVSKDTPIFSVLKPVVVPNEKSGPKRLLIIAIWTFLGLIGGSGKVVFESSIRQFMNQLRS
jgi:LPS O-antigen subunit length determinant protein (WzzB/FepE family)